MTWPDWFRFVTSRDQDRRELYIKLAESYMYPPWRIGQELSVVQLAAMWGELDDFGSCEVQIPPGSGITSGEQLASIFADIKQKMEAKKKEAKNV